MYVTRLVGNAGIAICAWGNNGNHQGRDQIVRERLNKEGINPLLAHLEMQTGAKTLYIERFGDVIRLISPKGRSRRIGMAIDQLDDLP